MTYNEKLDQTVVGACTAMCTKRNTTDCQSFNAIETNDTSELNTEMCKELNRAGQLCGRCEDNHGPEVYSYSLRCVPCHEDDFPRNLLKYIAIAFLPLTVFYVCVIALKLSLTSGSMVAYILTCQIITTPLFIRILKPEDTPTLLLINCFSIWNLDFLRSVYPPFCLHPKMETMHVLALDYLVGVYPLFLILLTYLAIVIHDRCPRSVTRCFGQVQSIRGSLIQTFASFLVLAYVKILNVSFDLLFPVALKTVHGERIDHLYLYNDAEVVYFGKEHLPFGILAVSMLVVFSLLPLTLLMLYPCRCFQKCLNLCAVQTPILFTFMDAFQGCYRHAPRDCRYFAALYLFLRILQLLTFALVRDFIYIPLMGFYFLAITAALIFIEPYIKMIHNKIDKVFFLWCSSAYFLTALNVYLRPSEPQIPMQYLYPAGMLLHALLPITYGVLMVSTGIIPNQILHKVIASCRQVCFRNAERQDHHGNRAAQHSGNHGNRAAQHSGSFQESEHTPLLRKP
jgi:hypothetical protein